MNERHRNLRCLFCEKFIKKRIMALPNGLTYLLEQRRFPTNHPIHRADLDRELGVGRRGKPNDLNGFTLYAVLFHTDVSDATVKRFAILRDVPLTFCLPITVTFILFTLPLLKIEREFLSRFIIKFSLKYSLIKNY